MTSRERLLASLQGRPVDRLPVNFLGLGGRLVNPDDPDPFNVYNDPSWQPLLELAREKTDLTRPCRLALKPRDPVLHERYFRLESYAQNGSQFIRRILTVKGRELSEVIRRDPELNTEWTVEYLLKDETDIHAYLSVPDEVFREVSDSRGILEADQNIGPRGIAMIVTGDPVCMAADLLGTQNFLVLGLTEPVLMHALLEKISRPLYEVIAPTAQACPGMQWWVYGPEFAVEPCFPPRLFQDYVVRYTQPLVDIIHRNGGLVRLHCHGRIKSALPMIRAIGPDALDPLEPPPQGDVQLGAVRREYGRYGTLFGNLEMSDIDNLAPMEFEKVVTRTIREGTSGEGRGFVLMPSACPIGRKITARTLANYETIVRLAGRG